MKFLFLWLASAAFALAVPSQDFIQRAHDTHGAFGERAARFLVEHMPESDRESLSAGFLLENLDFALRARTSLPWADEVPEELFFNEVLPYAVLDEPRDPWRADFFTKILPLVERARSASEAAQMINRDFFKQINTHYHLERKRANQSPRESMELGKATCTGLSIILVDACRSVGIPARAVGTSMWSDGSGNHTWVEIWDGRWHFLGADEYDQAGLDRGWFVDKAAQAEASDPATAIYASSWRKGSETFPTPWSPHERGVGAVNVTHRYVSDSGAKPVSIGVRYFDGSERVAVAGALTTAAGHVLAEFLTKAGTADLNDAARVNIEPDHAYRLRFHIDHEWRETIEFRPFESGITTYDVRPVHLHPIPALRDDEGEIARKHVSRAIRLAYEEVLSGQKEARAKELDEKAITQGEYTLKWQEKVFGEAPDGGRSLWISLHGGGQASSDVNDQQWQNQLNLYQLSEGIYLAPRAPTDTWDLWHQAHIDPLLSRLIESMIALRGVNPNKVYLMGYSAGGDGVWQLAPRMADRFAAAAMMAGHPNDASLLGLRNLPFAILMGGEDKAYDRNRIAAEKTAELSALNKADPEGYRHFSRIYRGLPHWMNGKDAEAVPWMAKFARDPWPKKILWFQDDVVHERLYWLQLAPESAVKGQQMTAAVNDQTIHLTGDVPESLEILLSDEFIDLDRPIMISVNQAKARQFKVDRSAKVMRAALTQRLDPLAVPSAVIRLK